MKLILCKECKDIFSLDITTGKQCRCGSSVGQYVDERLAIYGGSAIVLGVDNQEVLRVISNDLVDPQASDSLKFFKISPTSRYLKRMKVKGQ